MEAEDKRLRRAEVERAHLANQIASNPVWGEVWKGYRDTLIEHMTAPGASNEHVLQARDMLIAVDRVAADLAEILETGELASKQLEEAADE